MQKTENTTSEPLHFLRCTVCKICAELPGCAECTPGGLAEAARVIDTFIRQHEACADDAHAAIEVHAHGEHTAMEIAVFRDKVRALPAKLPYVKCCVCDQRETLPYDLTGDDLENATAGLVGLFIDKHEACGRVEIFDALGRFVVGFQHPNFQANAVSARSVRELVSEMPPASVPCPSGCGGNVSIDLSKAFSPGHLTVCDKCGQRIHAGGAFDMEGNRL